MLIPPIYAKHIAPSNGLYLFDIESTLNILVADTVKVDVFILINDARHCIKYSGD